MGIFDGVLICTDLDGTFLHNAKASEENCRAIKYYQENGGLFTVSTGRSHAFVRSFENYTPNAPLIVNNGTMLMHHKTRKVLAYYDMPEYTGDVLDELRSTGLLRDIFLYDMDDGGTDIADQKFRYWHSDMECAPSEFFNNTPRPWLKILFQSRTPEDNFALREYIRLNYPGKFETSRSYEIGLELHAPGSGKGACVNKLRELYPNIDLVVCAGDYDNDISMIECADIGYAVANAQPDVLKAADRITVDCRQHAIAKIIEDIEKERANR